MGTNLVLGFFDGVHLGHQEVINSAVCHGETVLLTLEESPAKFFGKNSKYILSREDSINKIKFLGVTEVIQEDFGKIHSLSADDYLESLIKRFKPQNISTGFNYTFGANKSGNAEFLRRNQEKYGYNYICVPPFSYNGEIISSTLIKSYLKKGNIKQAGILLGSSFILEGKVIQGAQLGRKIGFPTANINYPSEITEIPYGAYAVRCAGKAGIMNYGIKPTVNLNPEPVAEVHILDFEGDLYGQTLKVEVIDRIRDEKKFDSIEELKSQIERDRKTCLELLS